MRDGVGVPAFGEHGHGNNATDLLAEFAGLADGVHHFAQEIFIGKFVGIATGKAEPVVRL